MPERLLLGLSLSLSGAYAAMGRQAEAAVKLFVDDLNSAGGLNVSGRAHELELRCFDDRSDALRCAESASMNALPAAYEPCPPLPSVPDRDE